MNKKQFKANKKYLSDIGVFISDEPVWENEPYSRELFFSSNAGGDLSICVEELTRAYLDRIDKYDQSCGLNSVAVINDSAIKEARK